MDVPLDVMIEISTYLDLEDILVMCHTSKSVYEICKDERFWTNVFNHNLTKHRTKGPWSTYKQYVFHLYKIGRRNGGLDPINRILYTDMPPRTTNDDNFDEDNDEEHFYIHTGDDHVCSRYTSGRYGRFKKTYRCYRCQHVGNYYSDG